MRAIAGFCVVLAMFTATAHAHAPDARRTALSAEGGIAVSIPGFGLLMRESASKPFVYVCDALIEEQLSDVVPSLVYRADGSLLMGTLDGLRNLGADGCPRPRSPSPLSRAPIAALAVARTHPEVAYAAVSGGAGGIYRSDDGGDSWSLRTPLADAAQITSFIVRDDDVDTLFMTKGTSVLSSFDGALTWSNAEQERALSLLAVPNATSLAFWALARSSDNTTNRGYDVLQASAVSGPWRSALRVNYFGGFVIDDGRIWIGDEGGGVYVSRDHGDSFETVSKDDAVACLAANEGELVACTPGTTMQPALSALELDAGLVIEGVAAFADVVRMPSCAGADVATRCATAWFEWQRDVLMLPVRQGDAGALIPEAADAGLADAGLADAGLADAGLADAAADLVDAARAAPRPHDGCSVVHGDGSRVAAAFILALGALLRVRRSRYRPS